MPAPPENAPKPRFRLFVPILAGATLSERVLACVAAFVAIGLTALVTGAVFGGGLGAALIVAPMGASAVLVFAVPSSPLAQPWPVVGGNAISALAGVAVMLTSGLLGGTLLGSMVALLCCLCYAGMIVALRAGRATDMTPAACLAGFLALVVCVPAAGSFDLPARDWALGIALGAVQLGLQMILTVRGARAVPAAQVMLLLMIEIVLAPLWVWLAFGEEPGTWSLAGGAIVVAAILWNALGGRRGAASAA